jgi:DNA polymerase-3 subunit gamma/tau
MSEYIVTARKWRPMRFEDVAGQTHVTTTLRNAIATRRLAHAYLFSGPRGVGKTTTARLLAKSVNCLHPQDANPDNTCDNCREITEGRSFDVLEIDGASNRGVEEIRNLRESVRYAPARGQYRVYIIDEVHMLTKEAFNALLKTLEEPPSRVLFIFATTEIHKLPATILSRCQRFDFRRISIDEIMKNLRQIAQAEGLEMDSDALLLVAKRGDGSLRDAQSIFDQVISLCGRTVTYTQIVDALNIVDQELYFRVTDLIKAHDTKGALALVDELLGRGHDIRDFLSGLIEHFRNLLIAKETGATSMIETSDHYRKRYAEESRVFGMVDILRLQRFVGGTESAIRWSSQPRFKLEADLVQLVTLPQAPDVADILSRLDELKRNRIEPLASISGPPSAHNTAPKPMERKPQHAVASATKEEPGLPSQRVAGISENEVRARWDEFVAEICRQRISLGSALEGTRFLGVRGQSVLIGCATDFQISSISRHREALADIFRQLYHVSARIEGMIDAAGSEESGRNTSPPPSSAAEDHPVIAAMKRELGAEPLQ